MREDLFLLHGLSIDSASAEVVAIYREKNSHALMFNAWLLCTQTRARTGMGCPTGV